MALKPQSRAFFISSLRLSGVFFSMLTKSKEAKQIGNTFEDVLKKSSTFFTNVFERFCVVKNVNEIAVQTEKVKFEKDETNVQNVVENDVKDDNED